MTIQTAKEAIESLQQMYGNSLDETLVITWWDSSDFEGMDLDDAYDICEKSLEDSIGSINDDVESTAKKLNDEIDAEERG